MRVTFTRRATRLCTVCGEQPGEVDPDRLNPVYTCDVCGRAIDHYYWRLTPREVPA